MKKTPKTANATSRRENPAPADAPALLTMDEAIGLLKTTRQTFYRWVRAGKLRGTKIGRQWRFTREDVDRFLHGKEVQVDLPAAIDPLIHELEAKFAELGVPPREEQHDKVPRAVALMIRLAIALKSTDIHIDAHEGGARLRYRVDGELHLVARFDLRLLPAIAERWKTLAAMDVREKALPQDGRIELELDGVKVDLRVCCVPAFLGESLVARVMHSENILLDLDRLPYSPEDRKRIDRALAAPWGMIVVAGPTGCGKTTTLYSCLLKRVSERSKVISVEDPVEYVLAGVTQIRVNHKNGLSMESILRAVFRCDPDVLMVGEIRNADAMNLSLQAAITGHLVLTTLHVDEAAGALKRMIDIGCEPFVVADAAKLIVAQRLVRKLCPECSVEESPSAEQLARAEKLARAGGLDWETLPRKFRKAVGCKSCGQLGYRGRTLIAETLEMSPEIASALRRNAAVGEIRAVAVGQGMRTIAADGIRRAAEGQASLAEILSMVGGIDY